MDMEPTVFIVDDDRAVRSALGLLIDTVHLGTEAYDSAEAFLEAIDPDRPGCLVLDIRMSGMSGINLQVTLASRGITLPIIFLTGHGSVPMSVQALRGGAIDFIEKPFDEDLLLERIHEAIRLDRSNRAAMTRQKNADLILGLLTPRELEVMKMVVAGKANKVIATDLRLSPRTVETHRWRIMEKTGAHSLADLIELAQTSSVFKQG
jgi:FixJ family two-component response regulator